MTLAHFTPAEAERITGVNVALQRDWRRRGYLPVNEGHARFDAFAVARMLAMKVLADRGIGPAQSYEQAGWCSLAIVSAALEWSEAWEGDHMDVPEVDPDADWGAKAFCLRRELWDKRPNDISTPLQMTGRSLFLWYSEDPRRFIWWADGTHGFHASVDTALSELVSSDPKVAGPIVIMDLDALGSTMIVNAARPFVHVKNTVIGGGR